MTVEYISGKALLFSAVSSSEFQWLQRVSIHADPSGCDSARKRLTQSPVHESGDAEDEIQADWEDLILPELTSTFITQQDTLSNDLRAATSSPGEDGELEYEIQIPLDHVELWFGAINQARLVMQERYHFVDPETEEDAQRLASAGLLEVYLTSQFYTVLQSMLLELVMDPDRP